MSSSYDKARLVSRYLAGGAFNTLFGFAVIFALMAFGVAPIGANIGGYAVGLLLSFAVNRGLVFRAQGHVTAELPRYLAAFAVSFAANLLVLYALSRTDVHPVVAQVASIGVYVVLMFWLCQSFVFRTRSG